MLAIEMTSIYKTYPKKANKALDNLSLSVPKGSFFGLLGQNGAGKSTTLNVLSGLISKDSGKVLVQGYDLDKDPFHVKCSLGIVPQEFNFNIFESVEDIIFNQAGYYGLSRSVVRPWVDEILHQLGLWPKRKDAARTLSGGMKRRLMIARGLVHRPSVLILDEPSAGVDVELRRQVWQFLRTINEQGTTIVMTTHYLEEVEELCDNVAIIQQGQLLAQTSVAALLRQLKEEYFVLDLNEAIMHDLALPEKGLRLIGPLTLEFKSYGADSLGATIAWLHQQGIGVRSMRPRTNRLEELFLSMTQHGQSGS